MISWYLLQNIDNEIKRLILPLSCFGIPPWGSHGSGGVPMALPKCVYALAFVVPQVQLMPLLLMIKAKSG